ncbi:hypothetical protein OROGR_013291 [Orobanche gracilis]
MHALTSNVSEEDPREKAKSETRDWLNDGGRHLENQIDSFEAEIEGLSVKKGKTRPPRLIHLETSIARHKAHIMKLILILRLLDNDELSPEQVNDVKDFLDDYVESNQEDFDEFSDADDLYNSLPLDKVESLEDLVTIGPPGLVKWSLNAPFLHEFRIKDTACFGSFSTDPVSKALLLEEFRTAKEEEITNFPGRKSSPALAEAGLRAIGRGGLPSQPTSNILASSGNTISSNEVLGTMSSASEMGKIITLGSDDRSSGMAQSLVFPISNRVILPQAAKASDGLGSVDTGNVSDVAILGSRVFTSPVVPGIQWRPGSSFQNQNEAGQFRGRTEIAPDQREKFLQRFEQVQQQGQTNLLGMPSLTGGKQYSVGRLHSTIIF